MERQAGILLPLFSVPGNQGIGDLGQKTLMMIDELSKAGIKIWSMLPLQPTQGDNSPYSMASAYAGDPIYINIDRLAEMDLLTQSSVVNCNKFKSAVDYETVRQFKEPYFQRAFKAFRKNYSRWKADFEKFKQEAWWLNSWTVYELFRQLHDGKGWTHWDSEYQTWPELQGVVLRNYVEQVFYIQFLQFIFYRQLDEVSDYARSKGLLLMQDVPFFVNLESAEVWSKKDEYMVDRNGTVKQYAGCPPDPYHEKGQVWEKPMYNFEALKASDYKSFRNRFVWIARNFDAIRIIHFKGFDFLWKVPENRNPQYGQWAQGPGRPLMEFIKKDLPHVLFTAEDQGEMRPTLKELESEFDIPVMDVLQYRMETKKLKRPAPQKAVIYTTFYDTPTLEQDYSNFINNRKIALRRFFKKRNYLHRPFHDLVVHYAIDSDSDIAMIPMQDVIGLKEVGRINDPEHPEANNWTWKLKDFRTFPAELAKVREWLEAADRIVPNTSKEERATPDNTNQTNDSSKDIE
ncbi:MAG: 4-alpha-glucanotransferase [Allobaculum sp.]|nr:4-alpha-glucanotransferase [Allobaculum sp.]